MSRIAFLICLFVLSFMAQSAELPPELLFKDTFDTTKYENDINLEIDVRQSGRLAPLTYVEQFVSGPGSDKDRTGCDGVLKRLFIMPRNASGQSLAFLPVSPNHNFRESPRFIIEVNVEPVVNDAADTSL